MVVATLLFVLVLLILSLVGYFILPGIMDAGFEAAQVIWDYGCSILTAMLTGKWDYMGGATGVSGLSVATDIMNSYMVVIGTALLALFAFAEFAKSLTTMLDMKRIETVVKALLRIGVCAWLVTNMYTLMDWVYNKVFVALTSDIANGYGTSLGALDKTLLAYATNSDLSFDAQLAASWGGIDVGGAYSGIKTFVQDSGGASIGSSILGYLGGGIWCIIGLVLVVVLVITVMSTLLDIIVTLGQRFLRIWIHVIFAPVAASTFASSDVSFVGKQFAKSFVGVASETVIGAGILILFPKFLRLVMSLWGSSQLNIVSTMFSGASMELLGQCIWGTIGLTVCFGCLKQLIKAVDQFAAQMLGIGGA